MLSPLVEAGFFDKYWPSLSSAPTSEGTMNDQWEEGVPESEDARAAKLAKTEDPKSGNGKGNTGDRPGKRRDREESTSHRAWSRQQQPQRQSQKYRGSWQGHEWDKDEDGSLAKEVENLRECVFALQKLTLRHEDVLSSLKAELSWALFLRVDMKASVVKPLYAMQQEWRDLKEKSPNQLQGPMCVSLVRTLFKEFGKRIEMLPQQTEQLKIVRNLGWMEPEALVWRYVQWGPAAERLKPQIDREGVPLEKVAALIASIQELVAKEGAVRRFHPNRKLEATMGGHNLTFGLQMSICGEASKSIREHLAILSGLAATQLIGMGLRPERPGRSHLANQIQRQIRK